MQWLLPAQVAALIGSVFLALCYLYVYWRSPERYLLYWLLAWLVYPLRHLTDLIDTLTGGGPPIWAILSRLALLATTCLLLAGVLAFNRRRIPRLCIGLSAITGLWVIAAPLLDVPFMAAVLPVFAYLGLVNIWAGIVLLRQVRGPGLGRAVSGVALILWGLHRLDYPFLRPVEWFAPWGYLIASTLAIAVALGILIFYFERVWWQSQAEREEFARFADNTSDVIFRVRMLPTPGVDYLSPAIARLTGYPPQEFYDNPALMFEIVLHEDVAAAQRHFASPLAEEPLLLRLRHRDGRVGWIELRVALTHNTQGRITEVQGIARDVSVQKERERELGAIASVTIALRDTATQRDVQRVVLDHVTDLLRPAGASFGVYDPDTGQTTFSEARGVWAGTAGASLPEGANVTGWVIETGQPYFTDHPPADPRFYRPELVDGMKVACLPLIANQQVMGVLGIAQPERLSSEEVRVLIAVADIAASALARARVVESLERRVAQRTAELAAANERIRELDRLKSRFVTDVSHELRTPVTSLSLYIQLLEQGRKDKQAEYLAIMRQEIERLAGLVQSVLDLSRLDLVEQDVVPELVDVNALARQVAHIYRLRAEAGGLTLTVRAADGLPPVKGNREQLVQMLNNLVVNALSYTPQGEIVIETGGGPDHTVCVTIKDTGLGIDPEDMEYLFERFYRGRPASVLNVPGTGVGLAIVREIVHRHAGRIEVESRPGQGSAFRVWLPAAGVDEAVG